MQLTRPIRTTRSVAVFALAALAVAAPLSGCSLIDKAKDRSDEGKGSAVSSAPARPAGDDAPAPPVPSSPSAPASPASPSAPGDPARIGVCDVVMTQDVQTHLQLAPITSRDDNLPFTCRYDGPDGKQVLNVLRTLLFGGQAKAEETIEAEIARGGAERVNDLGVPAVIRRDGVITTLVFARPMGGDQVLKVTIMPYGSKRDTDAATIIALARATLARL